MKTFQELLEELDACGVARDWAAAKTIEEVVAECHRGDWLLWLAFHVNVDKRKLTLAKAHCANTVRHLMKDERSLNAVDIAMAYGKGEVEHEALIVAAFAADIAYIDDIDGYCYRAAAYAAYAAAIQNSGCAAINDIANAADMAAAYDAAYGVAYGAAKSENQKQTADICREYIGKEIIEEVNEILNSKTI
jgi:hypothetical protein